MQLRRAHHSMPRQSMQTSKPNDMKHILILILVHLYCHARAQRQHLPPMKVSETPFRKLRVQFPNAKIRGHRDFAAKACPSFDATAEYANI